MTDRKILQLRAPADTSETPALRKKGRGWEISSRRLDALHDLAREMKRHASPAHLTLAERFAKADLGKYAFTRFAVVGSAILDFNCHNLGMAVCIDEADTNETLAKRRDKTLEAIGIRVMRIKAEDIMTDIDVVLARITAGMRSRMTDRRSARQRHLAENPNQTPPKPGYKLRENSAAAHRAGPRKTYVKD